MEKKMIELIDKAVSRRKFLAGSGAVAATAIAGCSGGSNGPAPTPFPPTPTPGAQTDVDILNFALNLEYLEAQFYLYAATGSGLSAADTGNASTTVVVPPNPMVPNLTTAQQNYINEIAQNELDHVRFLRSALGSSAVSMPNLDLMNSFNAAAAATTPPIGSAFNPFASYQAFLVGAFVFEDVGVTAYHGAASFITTPAYLTAAAEIMAVEAYHAAEIRTLLIENSVATATTTATKVTPNDTYVNYAILISNLRAALGGGNETPPVPLPPYNIPFVPTAYKPASAIVAADPMTSIAYARTFDQVLHVVYAAAPGAGVTGGGFFPNGMNGSISVTQS